MSLSSLSTLSETMFTLTLESRAREINSEYFSSKLSVANSFSISFGRSKASFSPWGPSSRKSPVSDRASFLVSFATPFISAWEGS